MHSPVRSENDVFRGAVIIGLAIVAAIAAGALISVVAGLVVAGVLTLLGLVLLLRESSFRNFAELCITRQMITAVKTASRNKHAPLNQSISFATSPTAAGDGESTLEEILPGSRVEDPASKVISTEELGSLVECLTSVLSELESEVLTCYLDGRSYEEIAERLACDTKTVDNALQRVKRKVSTHLASREVLH